MRIKKNTVFLLFCAALFAAGIPRLISIRANTIKVSADEGPSWQHINRAASQVKNGDEGPIRVLTDEVFKHHGIDQAAALPPVASMKDSLVKAESHFQNGEGHGITEKQVAATVNQLADRLGAPDYAHTNEDEVKRLRLRMLTLYPSFVGRGPSSGRDDSRPHFDATMGPLEAFHVTATMPHQKVFNPEFQVSQQEAQDSSLHTNSADGSIQAKGNSHGERASEMLNIIQQHVGSMTDLADQCGHSLDLLGVPK
jgi:hypothetical protein